MKKLLLRSAILLFATLVMQKLVMMLYAQYLLSRTEPQLVNLGNGITGVLTSFWDYSMQWQMGEGVGITLTILFGLTAGLLRRRVPLSLIPLAFGVMALLATLTYVGSMGQIGSLKFWEGIFWRGLSLPVLALTSLAVDAWFTKWFEETDPPRRGGLSHA